MELRFVILLHSGHGAEHFDMMLECGGALATWQFAAAPTSLGAAAAGQDNELPCRRIQDHRLAYLEFEGPVSGGRGRVTRIEQGRYRLVKPLASTGGLDDECWLVELAGGALAGRYELRKQHGDQWIFRRERRP